MTDLPIDLYSPEKVRELDRTAIEELGIPGLELMHRAGARAYAELRRRWPRAQRLRVVCGLGNNAGDGYVIARLALAEGLEAVVLSVGDRQRLQGDALTAAEEYRRAGGVERELAPVELEAADVIVDAVFGTGLRRPVEGRWRAAVEAVNAAAAPVLAVDVPSGLDAGSGRIWGQAVQAELTVTFIALKTGLLTGAGPACCGELVFDALELPQALYTRCHPEAQRIDPRPLKRLLAPRPRDAHKGRYGHVLVVGGDQGMGGAARMAAEAAARVGAGLVSVATRGEHVGAVLAARPELMVRAVAGAEALEPLIARASVVVLGPGLGQEPWGRELFRRCVQFDGPLVVDADGLNLLAVEPRQRADWVLTPHPGEAGRLLGLDPQQVQEDRLSAAGKILARYGGTAVLKGAGTVVQGVGQLPRICTAGNPGMASGGMGDVLSGVLGGLLAQGLEPADAAWAGVWLHAAAADAAAAANGERGLLAGDLLGQLQRLVNP